MRPNGLGKIYMMWMVSSSSHSGCPVPEAGEKVERNEGGGIVLDPDMVRLWKNSGEMWNPVQCSPQAVLE